MWHDCCFSRCSRPIEMKKLSYKNRCKVACHAHVSTLFIGHKQRFIHTHVTRSPPIGIAKLSEVFMNYPFMLCCHLNHWEWLFGLKRQVIVILSPTLLLEYYCSEPFEIILPELHQALSIRNQQKYLDKVYSPKNKLVWSMERKFPSSMCLKETENPGLPGPDASLKYGH